MDAFVWLLVIGIAVWLLSNSRSSNGFISNSPSKGGYSNDGLKRSSQVSAAPVNQYPRTANVMKEGFQPDDRCSCGGTWVKRKNSETGGRFFSCSRYPACKNSREKVLKARLGVQYSEIYCSRGHHKPTSGTILDPATGKSICKKCVDKGYLTLRSRSSPSRGGVANRDGTPTASGRKNPGGQSSVGVERCKNGHIRTKENIYVRPDGSRECRVCRRNSR